jgi:hypothetical protein
VPKTGCLCCLCVPNRISWQEIYCCSLRFIQSSQFRTDHVRCQPVHCYLRLMQLQWCTTHISLSVMWYTIVVVLIDNAIAMMYHCSSFNW